MSDAPFHRTASGTRSTNPSQVTATVATANAEPAMDGWSRLAHAPEPHQLSKEGPSMAEVRTPEGVIVRVTGRPPELFLRIITPSGREFGWPVHAGTIGTMSRKR